MNDSARTFVLVGLVVVILLALHLLPTLHIGDTELRKVNILSDVLPEYIRERDAIDHIPTISGSVASADSICEDVVDDGLTQFYYQLDHIKELGRPLRIAYFGDSFIEGDILSCDLREQLQDIYGGSGVGWVDCGSQVSTFRQTVRHSFQGIDEYDVVKRPFNKQVESIAQRYFIAQGDAGFSYKGVTARQHLNAWSSSTFFFRTSDGFTVSTSINNDSIQEEYVSPSERLQTIKKYRQGTRSISYSLTDVTPNTYLYGVALESESGVVVDNFSMRGSSGVSLKDMPKNVLREFAAVRPYDLIIVHFGLNVVNEKSHAANYKAYTNQMGKAIEHLREAFPEASILVVSMPDRDQRTAAGIRTMLGIESLVAYQQIMAAEHHTAFFNLFEAMGGRESMKRLVDQGLANKDYTHLTIAGGRRLGALIVNYLSSGYDRYKSTHQ